MCHPPLYGKWGPSQHNSIDGMQDACHSLGDLLTEIICYDTLAKTPSRGGLARDSPLALHRPLPTGPARAMR